MSFFLTRRVLSASTVCGLCVLSRRCSEACSHRTIVKKLAPVIESTTSVGTGKKHSDRGTLSYKLLRRQKPFSTIYWSAHPDVMLFRPSATVSRIGLMESCLRRHCRWCGGPPLAGYPPPPCDGWLGRSAFTLSVLVYPQCLLLHMHPLQT